MRSIFLLILACLAVLSGPARAGLSAGDTPAPVLLDRSPDRLVSLSLATADSTAVPEVAPIEGPWRLASSVDGVRTWEAVLPTRTRTLFFHRAPEGMDLVRVGRGGTFEDGRRVPHRAGLENAGQAGSWEFDTRAVRVRRAAAAGAPESGEYGIRYAVAVVREEGLDRGLVGAKTSDADFVFRSVQVDDTTRHGLYLPAPAEAIFDIDVPQGGRLVAVATVVPPEAGPQGRSDGADLVISVDGQVAARYPVEERVPTMVDVDLSAWSGQEVALGLATEGGGASFHDDVFLAEPTVYAPQADPPRVVLVFVDTLRADHMSLYGYERPTTPRLDGWAQTAAVFEQARSVAPWTLPSTRTMLTGSSPERWESSERLQDVLASRGWSTAFISGNVYLSSNFEMADGWGTHRCINWPTADVQVDRALSWLDDHADRPSLLMLHLMDMHLPYTEPPWYRHVFAGEVPEVFDGDAYFNRGDINRAEKRMTASDRQYVRDRYDNNLRFVDDQIAHLLDAVGNDTVVVVLSDHGEEFWDHGGFEHGHTLFDELLRVPLVIKAPGLAPGRYVEPVSLMDLAPTLLRALDVAPGPTVAGWALQDLADRSRSEAFADRPLAFGRPLYGYRRWGVLDRGQKYTTTEGKETIHDLGTDPQEHHDLVGAGADPEPMRARLAEALGVPSGLGFRLVPSRSQRGGILTVDLTMPGGVLAVWPAEDPLGSGDVDVVLDGESVAITWNTSRGRDPREVFLIPERPAVEVLPELAYMLREGGQDAAGEVVGELPLRASGAGGALLRARLPGRTVDLTWAVAPVPTGSAQGAFAYDAELANDLEALGYVGH